MEGNMDAEREGIERRESGRHERGGDIITLWCLSIEV